jgi:hypothetical protein
MSINTADRAIQFINNLNPGDQFKISDEIRDLEAKVKELNPQTELERKTLSRSHCRSTEIAT